MKKFLHIAALLTLFSSTGLHAAESNYCGEMSNAYGPFDYRRRAEFQENFHLVEMGHFTPDVENGIRGSSGKIGSDVDYTLRAIPNHHRALRTMVMLALRERSVQVADMRYPVECWFIRALRQAPDDGIVYATYGSYLYSLGKNEKAMELFKQGLTYDPDNATLNYNIGLLYLKQRNYAEARAFAKKAYAAGFPLPGLKNKLIEAKQWDEKD